VGYPVPVVGSFVLLMKPLGYTLLHFVLVEVPFWYGAGV